MSIYKYNFKGNLKSCFKGEMRQNFNYLSEVSVRRDVCIGKTFLYKSLELKKKIKKNNGTLKASFSPNPRQE